MKEIPIDAWAAQHGVSIRTAQQWAKDGKISARKKARSITMQKTWHCWMVPATIRPPVK